MNRCEIKGNKEKNAGFLKKIFKKKINFFFFYIVGIILYKSDAIIKDSRIHNLKQGAIHCYGDETNKVKIMNNKVCI